MPDESERDFDDLRRRFEDSEKARHEHDEKRKLLVETQYRLHAMELQLAATEEHLRELEGFSVTRIVSALKGNRQQRATATREALAALNVQYDCATEAMLSLLKQVSEIESYMDADGAARADFERAFAAKLQEAETGPSERGDRLRVIANRLAAHVAVEKVIQKAIEAGDEARTDLLREIETLSSLGRCKLADATRPLKFLMNTARDKVKVDCADRVKQSLRRYLARFDEALSAVGNTADESARTLRPALEEAARDLSAEWLHNEMNRAPSSSSLESLLTSSNMVLEQCLNQNKAAIAQLEEDRRRDVIAE